MSGPDMLGSSSRILTLVRPRALAETVNFLGLSSGNSPTDRKMANAHHLDALVVRELLTDGGVATAFPQIGSEGQRTDKNNSGEHFRVRVHALQKLFRQPDASTLRLLSYSRRIVRS